LSLHLEHLNPEQLAAVTLPDEHALILAGAGSGKTRVLTTRIAWLVKGGRVTPAGILAVTFTNKAAREMLTRVGAMMTVNPRGMWVGTFHGLCNRFLRAHWKLAGLAQGFQILETIPHPTPTRDFNNVVLKIKAQNPDLVIPANYYNEYVLLARTMQQQHVRPKGIYSVLGGAASSYKFVKEFPDAAKYIMDCNHWFDPRNPKAVALKKTVEDKGQFYTYEVYMNYSCIMLVADALQRAASADRAKLTDALASSTFAGHLMPYGPTKFANGQNEGAAPVNTQVLDNDIKVILPATFANAKPVFPMPA